jgi:hypothetical protein
MLRILFFFLIFCSACSGPSDGYFQRQSREKQKELIEVLKKIESSQDFKTSSKKLEKLFQELVGLISQAVSYQQKSGAVFPIEEEDRAISQELQTQLTRVALMPGGLEMIEQSQLEAALKLQIVEERSEQDKKF